MSQFIKDFVAYIKEWMRDFLFGPPLPPMYPVDEYDLDAEFQALPMVISRRSEVYVPSHENTYVTPTREEKKIKPVKKVTKRVVKVKKPTTKKAAPKKPKKS